MPVRSARPLLLVVFAACGPSSTAPVEAPAPVEASVPPKPARFERPTGRGFRWVELEHADPDLDVRVAEHARIAREELGLLPIVHIATQWNTGGRLRLHKDAPEVHRALEGIYLIEIRTEEPDCAEDPCRNAWAAVDRMCMTWAPALHIVDARGRPGGLSATAGKSGPRTAQQNAEMLAAFRQAHDEGKRQSCLALHAQR